jgi:enoyl-CoA hydratase/carnithine racemase
MILHSVEEGILTLSLNRPRAANALDQALYEQLGTHLDTAAADANVKAVVLRAQGEKAFCAGADTREFSQLPRFRAELARRTWLTQALTRLLDFPKPIVCAIAAPAIGAGAMLALACDEVLMAGSAWIWFPEIDHDLPSPMGLAVLSARGGRRAARDLVQAGLRMDAATALRHQLVDEVVDDVHGRAQARALEWSARCGAAYAVNKAWMNRQLRLDIVAAAAQATEFSRSRYGDALEDQ